MTQDDNETPETLPGTRRFQSFTEIQNEPGYRPDNPVSRDNYAALLGPFDFEQGKEVHCCVQKANGNLCDRKHLRGWVSRLRDGSISVVGGFCAAEKFGADSTLVRDISRAENENKRLAAAAQLAETISNRDALVAELKSLKAEVLSLKATLARIEQGVGPKAWQALEAKGRAGDGRIQILGIVKEKRDKDDNIIEDRVTISITVGRIDAVRVCAPYALVTAFREIEQLEKAYRLDGMALKDLKPTDVRKLNAAFSGQPATVISVQSLLAAGKSFEGNDFTLLAYVVRDHADRVRLVQFGMRSGDRLSGSAAKRWIEDKDAEIRQQNRVEQLRIG